MIKYLQKLRNKKGFTLVELIIVVAIIAVLAAMVIPMFNNDDATRRVVNTYASDFYTGLQFNFTRYQKTEANISPAIAADSPQYIKFDKDAGQNVLTSKFLYIEARYDTELEYVHVKTTFENLTKTAENATVTAFEAQLYNDMKDLVNKAGKGYYYAVVMMNDNYKNLKVLTAHFTDDRVTTIDLDDLMFTDYSELANGFYCGTCTGDDHGGAYVGNIGTNFLNLTDPTGNALW